MTETTFWGVVFFVLLLVGCSSSEQPATSNGDGLTGQLVYIDLSDGQQRIVAYDLATEERKPLFTVSEGGWLAQTAVSPDGSQLVLSYAPPPGSGTQFANSNLYLMLADGDTEPRPVTTLTEITEIYFNPTWSPDSRYLYYAHNVPNPDDIFQFVTYVERRDIVTGEVEQLVANAFWPRLSPSGKQLAYVAIDPETKQRSLWVADERGENGRLLTTPDQFEDVDAPLFSPDEQWLYFSAVEAGVAQRRWWEVALGIKVALAHDVPSDWWRLPLAGGKPERVTTIAGIGMFGVINGRYFAFSSTAGLYLMSLDDPTPTLLLETPSTNSLSWLAAP
ncbi:MAG: hypothetical protein R3C62_06410 [Chloroflexota bacterium]